MTRLKLALLLLPLACASPPPDSGGDLTVTVSAGVEPSYAWAGGSALSVSVVRASAPGEIVWGVADARSRDLAPPIRHGYRPGAATESAAAERRLMPGVQYRVTVTLPNGRTGWRDFRP